MSLDTGTKSLIKEDIMRSFWAYDRWLAEFKPVVAEMTTAELLKQYSECYDTSVLWDNDPDKEKDEAWQSAVFEEMERRGL